MHVLLVQLAAHIVRVIEYIKHVVWVLPIHLCILMACFQIVQLDPGQVINCLRSLLKDKWFLIELFSLLMDESWILATTDRLLI